MKTATNNCYLYRHIRLDTNEVFYVGIGKKPNYARAFSESDRNSFWQNIVNKTSFKVEIVLDNLTWEQACEKEKELIALYGRRDLGTGTLVNLTDGGEGSVGILISDEVRLKLSLSHKGRMPANIDNLKISRKGIRSSTEHKKRLSISHIGNKNRAGKKLNETQLASLQKRLEERPPMLGKTHSEDTKLLMSESAKKRAGFAEGLIKLQQSNIGRKRSEESRWKMSLAQQKRFSKTKIVS